MCIQLIVVGGYAPKLLKTAEKSLNSVALGIARCVVGARMPSFAPRRNHSTDAAPGQSGYQQVGIIAAVSHHKQGTQVLEQRQGLWRVMAVASGEAATHELAAGVSYHVPLASQLTTAASEGLPPVFLRAPDACWCARTVVESTSSVCSADSS